jgi:integrase
MFSGVDTMPLKSSESPRPSKPAPCKPAKPHPDFPLFPHASGRWAKKVRGKTKYFGAWDDPQAALERWLEEKDDLLAGRTPRATGDGLTISELCNRFLTLKQNLVDAGELSPRTFRDYKDMTDRIVAMFGLTRLVDDLAADDFEQLRAVIARTRGPVSVGNEVQRIRTLFRYAFETGLVDRPVRFGPSFKRPAKRVLRKVKHANGPKMFESVEIRRILNAAPVQLKAMVLLGINAAFGNQDCGLLPIDAVDLDSGWIGFARPKTGIDRRSPLWPETVEALRAAITVRPVPKDDADAGLVFITKYGKSWHRDTPDNPVANEIRKLLDSVGIKRKGLGFYGLRHSFRTVADATLDFPAIDLIMGHADPGIAAHYRERISDDRLRAVTDSVHTWLFADDKE